MVKKRGLGRGLEALLGDIHKKTSAETHIHKPADIHLDGELKDIPLTAIKPGKYQPRKDFSEESIRELADSIRAQGVIQPIVVRTGNAHEYEIIAGERRFRAARMAGLETIPALVRELPDEAAIAIALIENIQREDLNPIEEAAGLQRLIHEFQMTHQEVANAVGKSRATVTNLLRLLSLEAEVRKMLEAGQLEMGHARALLSLPEAQQLTTAKTIAEKGLSVRDTEQLVKRVQNLTHARSQEKSIDPLLNDLQSQLTQRLTAKVLLQQNAKGQGKLIIKYKNPQHLRQILEKINTDTSSRV